MTDVAVSENIYELPVCLFLHCMKVGGFVGSDVGRFVGLVVGRPVGLRAVSYY